MSSTVTMLGLPIMLSIMDANAEQLHSTATLQYRLQKLISAYPPATFDRNHHPNATMIGGKKLVGQGCVDSGLHCTPGGLPCCDAGDDCYADKGSSYTYCHF